MILTYIHNSTSYKILVFFNLNNNIFMSKICSLTGKSVLTGNNVSHSNRKSRRRYLPNLQNVTIVSDILEQSFKLKICASTIRSIDINGGLDNYLIKTNNKDLTNTALKLKESIIKASNKIKQD